MRITIRQTRPKNTVLPETKARGSGRCATDEMLGKDGRYDESRANSAVRPAESRPMASLSQSLGALGADVGSLTCASKTNVFAI